MSISLQLRCSLLALFEFRMACVQGQESVDYPKYLSRLAERELSGMECWATEPTIKGMSLGSRLPNEADMTKVQPIQAI